MADVSRADIEELVRRVLVQLMATPASSTVPAKPISDKSETPKGTLRLDERVVSLRLLEGRLEGIQQMVVPRGAVVTPAVRDELKRRGIALQSAANGGDGKATEKAAAKLVIASTGAIDASPFAAALGVEYTVDMIASAADLAATIGKWTHAVLGQKTPGVILTDQPTAVLCLANRNYGIRAMSGGPAREISETAAAIGANGLVVDPRSKGRFEITAMVKAFAKGGWRSPPEALRRALNGT